MSLIPSAAVATPFNLPLFNAVLATSIREEGVNGEKAGKNGLRKWRMIGRRKGKCEGGEGGISEEENGEDGDDEQEEEEEGEDDVEKEMREKKEQMASQTNGRDQQQQQREDGAVQTQCQQQHMDIPTIAFQLLQQAMLRNEGTHHHQQQQRETEKFAVFGASAPSFTPSALSDSRFNPQRGASGAKFKKSGGPFASCTANGRRAVNKSSISAAATAALMAPSPLGALPAIPGALAVAASPAAQLFRDDDWSWHRNPAAAIRSGGTNKQTPVWKYFVYNKAENLSRCIVGTCTYQLKGPHTSTLACHLKKHAAEYAEFQRLKTEYTRERIVNGQTSSGNSSGGERPGSARSTPFAGHSSNGNAIVTDECPSQKSRSPSILSDPFPAQCTKSSNTSSPALPPLANGRVVNCSVLEDEPISGRSLLGRGVPTHQPPMCENGIFGTPLQHFRPLGAHPAPHFFTTSSPFQHFLMAAAAMAGQNNGMQLQQQQQQRFNSPPVTQMDCLMTAQMGKMPKLETNSARNGVGQQNRNQNKGVEALISDTNQLKKDDDIATGGICGSGGTGANLMDILNLLSKRAEAAASKENEQKESEETMGMRETEEGKRKRMKRKCTVERESDEQQEEQRQWGEDTQRSETLGERKEDEVTDEGQTQPLLTHSVEFLLKDDDDAREGQDESMKKRSKTEVDEHSMDSRGETMWITPEMEKNGSSEEIGMEEEKVCSDRVFRLSPANKLSLFLGTAFAPSALRHLMNGNPFLRHFCTSLSSDSALTFENIDKLLDSHFVQMKHQIRRTLACVRNSVLLVNICCWRCCQNGVGMRHLKDGCRCQKGKEEAVDLLCSVTLHQQKTAGKPPILLGMKRIRERQLNGVEENRTEKRGGENGGETDEIGNGMANCVAQILSNYFLEMPSSRPSLILIHAPLLHHFPASICSIPCSPMIPPHCVQKRLLTVLSEQLQMSQMDEQRSKQCSDKATPAVDALLLPSTSMDNNSSNESSESFGHCAKELLRQQQTMTTECRTTEFEMEMPRELVRLHDIVTEKPVWAGPEEMAEALNSIRKETFETIDGLARWVGTELSTAVDVLRVQQQRGLMADECLKNMFAGPLSFFGSVIEDDDIQWTERSAMLLFNDSQRALDNGNE